MYLLYFLYFCTHIYSFYFIIVPNADGGKSLFFLYNMTSQQILLTTFSFLPFVVCLFWFICFIVQHGKTDAAKHFFTLYIATCTVLYLCHALFFTVGLTYEMECLWTLCSLSVYPLFYGYLCRLTSSDYTMRKLLPWLLPGAAVAVARYCLPDAGIDRVRLLLFACQIVFVCYSGIRKLKAFDNRLQAVYADTEGRDTTAVHHLLVAIIFISVLAGAANSIGKHFFGESLWLLIPISLAFSTMLFALSFICFNRDFTIEQFDADNSDDQQTQEPATADAGEQIGRKLETLMVEQQFFLKKDLKIGDVVKEIGSNRTYVSNYINRTYRCSFSDYMNSLRIEHAKKLLLESSGNTKFALIAEQSGYSSEQSFYRNFRKFVGMTPAEWIAGRQTDTL